MQHPPHRQMQPKMQWIRLRQRRYRIPEHNIPSTHNRAIIIANADRPEHCDAASNHLLNAPQEVIEVLMRVRLQAETVAVAVDCLAGNGLCRDGAAGEPLDELVRGGVVREAVREDMRRLEQAWMGEEWVEAEEGWGT